MARDEWFRGLDLENAVTAADLVMVARVAEVTETKLPFGGKGERTMQEFKFEPVRTLKGVFARDALVLTSDDLGSYDALPEKGQMRLLILGRSNVGYRNDNRQATLDQSVPPLQGANDPLPAVVEVLVAMSQQRDRAARVAQALEALRTASGPSAIPLLAAVQRRALVAAQTANAMPIIARLLGDGTPAVRAAAAQTIRAVLEADYLNQRKLRDDAVAALVASLDRVEPDLAARVAMIEALGSAGDAVTENKAALAWLPVDRPTDSFAETAARLRAVARLKLAAQRDAVLAAWHRLALDASFEIEQATGLALIAVAEDQSARELGARFSAKLAAGLSVQSEIKLLGELPAASAVPALLDVAKLPLSASEKLDLVLACERITDRAADARLIPLLATMLDPRRPDLRWHATESLRKINTDDAARALQPHLAEEADLGRKLQLAEFLGRHKIRDGYPYAIEHMSEPWLRDQAIATLAAIRDPKSIEQLRRIWKTSNDIAWNSAAIRALGRLGDKDSTAQLLQLVQDLKNPLAPAALLALGDLGEANALANVRAGFDSRNEEVFAASVRAAGKLLSKGVKADDLRDRLAALVTDPDAPAELRSAALETLVTTNDPRLPATLIAAARDARLENSVLLERIEKLLRDRKTALAGR